MNELIQMVVSKKYSADEAAALARPYAIKYFSCTAAGITDQVSIDAFFAIKSAWEVRNTRTAPIENTGPLSALSPQLRCRKCGQTGHSGQYPFSTLPGSGYCDDCL